MLKNYLAISNDENIESKYFNFVSNCGCFIKMSGINNSKQKLFIGNFTQNNYNNHEQNDSENVSNDSDSNNFQNKLKKFTPFMGKSITLGTDKGH